jgi:hypothetical protein
MKMVTHTGGLSGMLSRVALVPEARLAVVVLTNQESGAGRDAIAYATLDAMLGRPATDWIPPLRESARAAADKARAAERGHEAARAAASRPSLPLSGYAGPYRDPWYGDARIDLEGGRLLLRFSRSPALAGPLEHWHHDTFVARWLDGKVPDAFVTFALRADGSVEQFKMLPFSPAADFSYDYQDLLFTPVREK